MSGINETEAVENEPVAPLSNDRILYAMCFIVIIGALISFVFVDWRHGLGFLIGGILSFGNYFWLNTSLTKLFDSAKSGESQSFNAASYFWRYLVLAAVILVFHWTKALPIVAIVLGIASFVFGVMLEAVLRVFLGIFKQKEF